MREATIENYLNRKAHELGGKSVKLSYTGIAGMPDRMLLMPGGTSIFVELKAPGGKIRPLQQKRMEQLIGMGFRCAVISSKDQADRLLKKMRKEEVGPCVCCEVPTP